MYKKIVLIFLGILIVVVFELSLYLTGKVYLYARSFEPSLPRTNVMVRGKHNEEFAKLICCIGDSHTFGVGTSSEYSYPKQLQTLLNLNNSDAIFKVANLGIPGSSTRDQIERLGNFLSKNKVELVILLTGRNNYYEVKKWKDPSFWTNAIVRIKTMRIYKIMQYALNHAFKIGIGENINAEAEETKYEDYIRQQLLKAKALCEEEGSGLLLLSYYNSQYEAVEKLAKELGILYFALCEDFSKAISEEDISTFLSRDYSHMNLYGYKHFAELLYEKMFSHRKALSLKLNPLTKKIDKDSFKQNAVTSCLRYVLGKSIFYEN